MLVFLGRDTEFGFEALREIGQTGKSNIIHYFRDIAFFVAQQEGGAGAANHTRIYR